MFPVSVWSDQPLCPQSRQPGLEQTRSRKYHSRNGLLGCNLDHEVEDGLKAVFLVQSDDDDDEDVALKNKNNRSPLPTHSRFLLSCPSSLPPSLRPLLPLSPPFAIADSNSCVGLRTNKPLHSPSPSPSPSLVLVQLVMLGVRTLLNRTLLSQNLLYRN